MHYRTVSNHGHPPLDSTLLSWERQFGCHIKYGMVLTYMKQDFKREQSYGMISMAGALSDIFGWKVEVLLSILSSAGKLAMTDLAD